MPFLIEEARARVELLLGWAVLPTYGQCCKELVTNQTWKRLRAHLHLEILVPHDRYLGLHVKNLYTASLSPVQHLANLPPNANLPALWMYGTHHPSAKPLRRVRVEHITTWSKPRGCRHVFVGTQDAFLPHGFADFVAQTMADSRQPTFPGWRHIRRTFFGTRGCAEFRTTTVRVLWRGFHVELAEQKRTLFEMPSSESTSDSESDSSSSSRSRSPCHSERP